MPPDNLREFLQAIDEAGELVRVAQPLRARLEIAEIADRCMKSPGGGPALLFEHGGQPAAGPVVRVVPVLGVHRGAMHEQHRRALADGPP